MPLDPLDILALLVVGAFAGLLGGMLGIGGSVILIPAMGAIFRRQPWDDQHLYQAAAMVVNVVVAFPAMLRHHRQGAVRTDYVRIFLPTTMAAVVVGVLISNRVPGQTLRTLFAIFLLYVCASTLVRIARRSADPPEDAARVTPARVSTVGVATGLTSGLLGIGGGLVSVPLASLLCRLPLRQAIAGSASAMVFSAALGAILKLATLAPHGQSWTRALLIAAAVAPTALLGGHIGAGLTHRAPVNALRAALALTLAAVAGRMAGIY
ncbi:MAG: sulfite exporter TauE/SafE family protein [Planctomycetota bacterium]|nr:sulfite exporter TauE/SafE family protein [Planctomycetota bacterium]